MADKTSPRREDDQEMVDASGYSPETLPNMVRAVSAPSNKARAAQRVRLNLKSSAASLVLGPGIRLTGDDLRKLLRPGVYVYGLGNEALYVGSGKNGMARCFGYRHKQASQAREICDSVWVIPCKSERDAEALEIILIRKLKPRFNKRNTSLSIRATDYAMLRIGR